jgi:hypothetical protein
MAGCSSGQPAAPDNGFSCREDMAAQFEQARSSGTPGSRPASCAGISDAQLIAFAQQIMSGQYSSGQGTAVPLPEPS